MNFINECFSTIFLCNTTPYRIRFGIRITAKFNKKLHDVLLHSYSAKGYGKKFIKFLKTSDNNISISYIISERSATGSDKTISEAEPLNV